MSAFKINFIKTIKSFGFALNGIRQVIILENNFRVHLVTTFVVIIAGLYFKISQQEWLWLLLFIAIVLIAETFNAAIEKLVDLRSPEIDPKAGLIKDLAAGAVLIAAGIAAIGGCLIFWKYLLTLM